MKRIGWVLAGCIPAFLMAQERDASGFDAGAFWIVPEVFLGAYHDDRVGFDSAGDAVADEYGELGAAVRLDNGEARYRFLGIGRYGYREYNEQSSLNDDFHAVFIALSSRENRLKHGVSGEWKKSLDYDTTVDLSTGEIPGAVLTSEVSTRYSATVDIGYEMPLTDRTSLYPGYMLTHYFQDFESQSDAEWQIHRLGLQLGYDCSGKTVFTLSGYASVQMNDEEDGVLGTVAAGARRRVSEKTTWSAEVGVSAADYEESGADQGFYCAVNGLWRATEKVSFYLFGTSDFQPGYAGGAARQVYRMGYGGTWSPVRKWMFEVQSLHHYQEEIGSGSTDPADGEWLHFFSAQARYSLTRRVTLALGGDYNRDEEKEDQTIVFLQAAYSY
jgi:hypothetical protein